MGKGKACLSELEQPVAVLRGVGPERAALLARLEVRTLGDLVLHRPRRYEDRRQLDSIAALKLHEAGTTHGRIVAQGVKSWRQRRKSVFEFVIEDGTGRLHCRWWNLPYMENYFHVGDEVLVFGRVRSLKPPTMDHPETETIEGGEERSLHMQRIVPVYPLTEGLTQRWLRGLIWRALASCGCGISGFGSAPPVLSPAPDGGKGVSLCGAGEGRSARLTGSTCIEPPSGTPLPERWPGLDLSDLPTRAEAIRQLHFPDEMEDAAAARRRLALDELIELQLAIQKRRRRLHEHAGAVPCGGDNRLMKPFLAGLGFELTQAQTRVLRDIRRDLAGAHPMRRLLQGDVGSGKTVVAACAALMTLESGHSVALMAPTEILAEQHAQTMAGWFGPLGLRVAIQTGSQKVLLASVGRAVSLPSAVVSGTNPSADPEADSSRPVLTVGTHALLEAGFVPESLGLVIIDEQHKFGVAQRERLVRKGQYPHLLVMTATPIPRTLGLTLYGDLDLSVIDQLPAGRGRVRTHVRPVSSLPKVWDFVRQKLASGRQAYVVCPRIEEDEGQTGLKAVGDEFARLCALFAPRAVGLLHGQLPSELKDAVMEGFRVGRIAMLVATSVIEVGVDVPNATVMVIENAESYGLAQLHQLRGRIGRGREESHCILIAAARTEEARNRLRVLEQTSDGFRIAETDLRLRGPGEFLGQAQSGLPSFRFVDLTCDLDLVERARGLAVGFVEAGAG